MRVPKPMLRHLGIQAAWLLCALGLLVLLFSAFDRDGIRHAPRVYREAIARASADPAVRQVLGTPIEATWWRELDIDLRGSTSRLRMRVHLTGSRRDGMLRFEAHRRGGRWRFDQLVVEPDGAPAAIDLL